MVRCIAMAQLTVFTAAWKPLTLVTHFGSVGPETLGRLFNVLGEPIDGKELCRPKNDGPFIGLLRSHG